MVFHNKTLQKENRQLSGRFSSTIGPINYVAGSVESNVFDGIYLDKSDIVSDQAEVPAEVIKHLTKVQSGAYNNSTRVFWNHIKQHDITNSSYVMPTNFC